MKSLFTPLEVQKLTGLSYRQLQYWDRSGFIKPTGVRGKQRHYTFGELVQLKLVKQLRSRMSIQQMRGLIGNLRGTLSDGGRSLKGCRILVRGGHIFLFTGEVLMSTQTVMDYVELKIDTLRDEVNQMFPSLLRVVAA